MKILSRVSHVGGILLILAVLLAIISYQKYTHFGPQAELAFAKSGTTFENVVQRLGEPMYIYRQLQHPLPLGNSVVHNRGKDTEGEYFVAAFLVRKVTPLFLVMRVKSSTGVIEDAQLETS